MPADPVAIARDLVRCPSVTPEEAGALTFLQRLLKQAGFTVHRAVFAEPGTTPWLTSSDLARKGALLVCEHDDAACQDAASTLRGTQPVLVSVRKKAWGMVFPASSYQLFFMLPLRG